MIVLVPVWFPNEGDALNIWLGLRCHLYPARDLIHAKYWDSFSINTSPNWEVGEIDNQALIIKIQVISIK